MALWSSATATSALCKFRNGTSNLWLLPTWRHAASTFPNIRYIIHYHLPLGEDVYTHRNGRTASMDASGTAILILSAEERLPALYYGTCRGDQARRPLRDPGKTQVDRLVHSPGQKNKVNKIDIVGFLSAQRRNETGRYRPDRGQGFLLLCSGAQTQSQSYVTAGQRRKDQRQKSKNRSSQVRDNERLLHNKAAGPQGAAALL